MPNGGYAWRCGLCKQTASSLTPKGPRCYQHGGTRKKAKDRLKSSQAKEAGKPLNPPGRPYTNGWYSRGEQIAVADLVERYRSVQPDLDMTDEDMLHLRARLNQRHHTGPTALEVDEQLKATLADLARLTATTQAFDKADPRTVETVLTDLETLAARTDLLAEAGELFAQFITHDKAIETRHIRLVKLAQTRATTRVKNSAAEQLDIFAGMLERLLPVLEEMIDADTFGAIKQRLKTELREVPKRVLEPNTTKRPE